MTCNVSAALITKAFYAVFVIFPRPGKNLQRLRIFARVLDCLMIACMLFAIGNEIYISYLSFDVFPLGFLLSSASRTICSVVIRVTLMTKSDEMISVIHQIAGHHRLTNHRWKDASMLVTAFCCCWIVPGLMTFYAIKTMMSENGDMVTQEVTFYGWCSHAWWLTGLAFFINCVNSQQVYALPGFCAILCAYATKLFSRAMKRAIKGIRVVKNLQQLLLYYTDLDRKLSQSLNNFNAAMSPILLLLYCYFVFCIFIVMTMMTRIWPKHAMAEDLIYHLTVFALSLSAFYFMSMQGANIHRVALEVKRAIYTSCLKLSSPVREEDISLLLLTMTDGFEIKTQISVLNMFSLNRTFILQTTGAIISYGIVIAQLGSGK